MTKETLSIIKNKPVCPPILDITSTHVYIGDSAKISVATELADISTATIFSTKAALRLFAQAGGFIRTCEYPVVFKYFSTRCTT